MTDYLKKAKHIGEYVLFCLLIRFLRLMSVDVSADFCSFIAKKIGQYLGVSNIARKNLKRVYGDGIDIEKTLNGLWDNFGRYIGELPFINQLNTQELEKRVKIVGLENVAKFQKNKQPFMMYLGHQANWDFIIRRINSIYPKFGIVYRKANNPYVDKAILNERKNDKNIKMIPKGLSGVKDLVRAIKGGMSIAMLVDQKMNDGIEVPFFGIPAMTAPAIARLSLQYNYPIVPLQLIRRKNTSFFEMIIHSPIKLIDTGNTENDCYDTMVAINKNLENWIRQNPAQWFWFHNRWK